MAITAHIISTCFHFESLTGGLYYPPFDEFSSDLRKDCRHYYTISTREKYYFLSVITSSHLPSGFFAYQSPSFHFHSKTFFTRMNFCIFQIFLSHQSDVVSQRASYFELLLCKSFVNKDYDFFVIFQLCVVVHLSLLGTHVPVHMFIKLLDRYYITFK